MTDAYDPSTEGAKMSFKKDMSYIDYLALDPILGASSGFQSHQYRLIERIIGFKRGTGGTSGVTYLRRMLDVALFPDLWNMRGQL